MNRQRNANDERVVNIFLTDAGRNIQARVAEMQKGVTCQTCMEETQFIELRSNLHEFVDSINQNQPDMEDAA